MGCNMADRDSSKQSRETTIRVHGGNCVASGCTAPFPCVSDRVPPLMLVNRTPVCSSSPLQSLLKDQQCTISNTEDATTKSSLQFLQSVHKKVNHSSKHSSARSMSSAADCSPRHRETWRTNSSPARQLADISPARRLADMSPARQVADNSSERLLANFPLGRQQFGDCGSHSSSMESGKDSGRASDTSSSGRSTPNKESFSMVCGRSNSCKNNRTETRQQLALRATRLVTSIRRLLA